MKKILIIVLVMALVIGLVPVSIAMAAKPIPVIERSNGFPSGMHFNLNIHGKDPDVFTCPTEPGGNSIFVPVICTSISLHS